MRSKSLLKNNKIKNDKDYVQIMISNQEIPLIVCACSAFRSVLEVCYRNGDHLQSAKLMALLIIHAV